MPAEVAVEVAGLRKSYARVEVLTGVDFQVSRGSVFSLLGPNGAGKTTTVRILATLTGMDAGRASVAGFDVVRERHKVRRAISLAGQYAAVDGAQTGAENLLMMARLAGLPRRSARQRAQGMLERFDLAEAASRLVRTYSGGMRRRLDLAASLIGRPAVIFLDEPTTGLDLRSRQAMWEVITDLTGSGVTIVLTTQYLEEADRLADQVAVVDAGRIVAAGTPAELKRRFAELRLDLTMADRASFDDLDRSLGARVVHRDTSCLRLGVPTDGTARHVRDALDQLDPTRTTIRDFTVHTATLDDVFLALTGHPASSAVPVAAGRPSNGAAPAPSPPAEGSRDGETAKEHTHG
jgi:ABC-2 type transport system ATP-binding protein